MNINYKKKILNYRLIEFQKKRKSTIVFGYPYWLTIDPTNICNLECRFCPTGQRRGVRPNSMLSFRNFKKIIDKLGPYLLHIDFCNWGEPFLNKEIFNMITYAKKFGPSIKVDTNFNIDLTNQNARDLINSGIDKIIVSLDGASQETYEIYRKNGNLKKVIDNVNIIAQEKKKLNKQNPHMHWQFLVFKHNDHEMETANKMWKEYGFDSIGFTAPFCSEDWVSSKEEFNRYIVKDGNVEFKPVENVCNWLWDGITINADGSVSPCCSVEEKKDDFDNFFSKPFFFLWNNKNYRIARKYVKDRLKPKKDNICTICDHIGASNHAEVRVR